MNAVSRVDAVTLPALDVDKLALWQRLTDGLDAASLYLLAAHSAALALQRQPGAAVPAPVVADVPPVTVLYGSQTGNARRFAEQLQRRLEGEGVPSRLLRMDVYPSRELAKESRLFVVVSTQGDGEPPDDARAFVDFLGSRRAPRLDDLAFAVLGLGDSSYPQFCAIGQWIDARLAELGGRRLEPAAAADLDIETVASPWLDTALGHARVASCASPTATVALRAVADVRHDRDRPFTATVLDNQRIVARDSERDVRHIELSLAGSGLRYRAGDALGVWPVHDATFVDEWLAVLGLDRDALASRGGRSLPLSQWLGTELELTRLSRPFVAALAEHDDALAQALQPGQTAAWAALVAHDRPFDLLQRIRPRWSAQQLVDALRPQSPRLYSIASSPLAVGEDEAHLTVAMLDHMVHGIRHRGAASTYLADGGDTLSPRVFIEANDRFRLPADGARDIIMIGPGTGVAPFRGFVQERRELSARGRQWLFFGNRHFQRDFLYQVEWQAALKDGSLHRLDLAFSRDQAQKRYVQHALREQGRELYAWLRGGAHLYVCGDAEAMAKDVHAALQDIAVRHGGLDHDAAHAWLDELMTQGRYARDVY